MASNMNIKIYKNIKEKEINIPNAKTKAAIKEGDRLIKNKNTKRYESVEELRKELNL